MKKTTYTGYVLIALAILLAPWLYSYAACTPLGAVTPNFGLCKPAVGETGWGLVVNANMDTIDSNLTNSLPRSYLAGFGLSNTAAATQTKIDIAPGQAQDAANAGALAFNTVLTKDLSAPWAVGSNQGCLGTAISRSTNTWYHIFIIKRTDTSVVDAYCDTNVNAANIPPPYTLYRRVGSIKTDATGSGNIRQFTQDGDYFRLFTSVQDYNFTNPGTSATSVTLSSVPTGYSVQALFNFSIVSSTVNVRPYLSDLAASDEAPSLTAAPLYNFLQIGGGQANGGAFTMLRTNTTQQFRYRLDGSDGNTIIRISTLGWWDSRGRLQ